MNPESTISAGTLMQGGFYVADLLVNGIRFGLIVSPKEQGDIDKAIWLPSCTDIPGAISYHDGPTNTLAMAEAGSEIARQFLALRINGYDDWYLGSRDELELAYRWLKPTTEENLCGFRDGENPSSMPPGYSYTTSTPLQTSVAAFQADASEAFEATCYWSSTQYSRNYAWSQNFDDGTQNGHAKSFAGRARAFRRFQIL